MGLVEILLAFVLILFVLCYNINRLLGLPPGPTPWPIVGNTFQMPKTDLDKHFLVLRKQYGDVFTVWIPFPTVVIAGHEALKRTVIRDGDSYAGRPDTFVMILLVQGNYGLIFEENAWYRSQRRFTIHTLRNLGVGKNTIKMYRYALAAITVFVAASVDSRPLQEDIEVELEATTTPIASPTSSTNKSAQSNDTQKGPQKSPGEPELIGFPGVTSNVAPWSSNGGYGTGAPDEPNTPMEPGPNGWQGPTGGHNGWPGYMGGYGCRSCGGHGHGYSSSGVYNGWPSYMGGYGCRGCGGHGHGYSSSKGYYGWPGYMGGFDGWKGPDMGGYGCRGCGSHGYGYAHNHQHHHHHHEYHGQGGGRRCENCGQGRPGGWGTFGGNGEKGGYGAPSDMGASGYGGYGQDNRGHGYGYGRGGQGYGSGF